MEILKRLLILFTLIAQSAFSQTIEKDWENFKSEIWTVKYVAEKTNYSGIGTQGHLVFENSISKKTVCFYIYLKSEYDNKIRPTINDLLPKLNCNADIHEMAIHSFFLGEHYYLLSFCRVCFVAQDKDCGVLSQDLKKYVKD